MQVDVHAGILFVGYQVMVLSGLTDHHIARAQIVRFTVDFDPGLSL
jgi:hypothetical protein